jgi:hypothetical protein
LAQPFIQYAPTAENYWRAIVLFGRNVATYKFALAQALLELRPASGQLVTLEELATLYTRHLREHLRLADKQGTFQRSQFLDACRKANAGELSEQQLLGQAIKLGFNNVIDAFHVVGPAEIPQRFFLDERPQNGGIRPTEEFSKLLAAEQALNLPGETDARWRLVETAWELGLLRSLVTVSHDPDTELLYVIDAARRRTNVTGHARPCGAIKRASASIASKACQVWLVHRMLTISFLIGSRRLASNPSTACGISYWHVLAAIVDLRANSTACQVSSCLKG